MTHNKGEERKIPYFCIESEKLQNVWSEWLGASRTPVYRANLVGWRQYIVIVMILNYVPLRGNKSHRNDLGVSQTFHWEFWKLENLILTLSSAGFSNVESSNLVSREVWGTSGTAV